MAYELNKKIVIDTEEFNNFAVGITLPIQRGDDGYFRQSFKTFDQVRSNLKNLLLTKRGERILQPDFGSGLHDLLFNPATEKFEEDLVNKLNLIPSKHRTNGPSRYYEYSNHKSKIGIISAISHNFCDTCNRVRLTCTGKLYMCLGQNDFVDLKFALRNQTKNDIIALIEYAMSIKPKAHNFEIQKDNFEGYVNRYMNETGG